MAELERRYLPQPESEVRLRRAEGKPAQLEGYAAVFNKPSLDLGGFREVIAPGAFRRAVKKNADVRSLVDHHPTRILGRTKSGTLRLEEDEIGLRMIVDLPDTTAGRDIAESVGRGDVDGTSFSFRALKDKWETGEDGDIRTLLDTEVADVGPVTFPAYPDPSIAVRSHRAWQEASKEPEPEKGPFNVNAKARLRLAEVEL